jgi:NADH-quinone oxidoreductase subunit J
MAETIGFWIMGLTAVAAALAVVLGKNIFRAALALVVCFLAAAGLFVILAADFLAAVQVLIYVGAIAVLIIMAIMLTREVEQGNRAGRFAWPALAAAVLFTGTGIWALLSTDWPVSSTAPPEATTALLGNLLFSQGGMVLVVEISALIIIATIIGAVSIAKENGESTKH